MKRRRARHRLDLETGVREALLGLPLPEGANPFLAFNEARLRELWDRHGEALLAEWVETHPGARPSSWWRVIAPDYGLRLRLNHGKYRDSEAAFLRRHELLLPGEAERIAPRAWKSIRLNGTAKLEFR